MGEKLQGCWVLVCIGKFVEDGKENWLFIKEEDDVVCIGVVVVIIDLCLESVKDLGDMFVVGKVIVFLFV